MEALRVGGLVSGLDTNSIIDSLMANAKAPIERLNQQAGLLTYEKKVYNDIISSMNGVKSSLLDLKMESTYKSKITTSSEDGVATGSASTSTPPGSYSVNVSQIAKPAYAVSLYTSKILAEKGAGVTGISSDMYPYDQVEGTHNVTISNPKSNQWLATDRFTPKNGQKFDKMTAENTDPNLIEANGKLKNPISNQTMALVLNFNGEPYTLNVKLDYPKDTFVSAIAQDIENQINSALDTNFANDAKQNVAVKTEIDPVSGQFKFAFYDTSSENKVDILGFRDPSDIKNTTVPETALTTLAKELGLFNVNTPVTTDEMKNVIQSNNPANLATKMNDTKGGLFPGVKFTIDPAGLTTGSFTVHQDSSCNNKMATKSGFTGATFSSLTNLVPPAVAPTNEELLVWMSSPLHATPKDENKGGVTTPVLRNYFDTKPSKSTNGFFHINGVKIEIEDYTKLTPNSLMAKINGSGAGVTASFDFEKGVFKVVNNKTGANDVTIGKDGDTSDILSLMKVTIPSGATYRRGSTEGSLSTGSKINDSGLTQSVATGIFTINGVSIYVDTNKDTIDDVIAKVNKSGANVTMAYDINTDKFTLTGKGAERITLGGEQDSSNFLQSIGLSYIFYQEETLGTPGSNAVFTVNGTKYERESNEVTDTIPGLSLSLVSEGITNINVKIDTDKAVNAMAEFASKYNTVINDLSPVKISDDFRSKYGKELSAEDKKGMSEDEAKAYQKNYESILKYDILSKSPELKQLKSTMRKNLMDEVSVSGSKYNSLTDLGIIIAGSKPADIQISSMGLLLDVSTDKEELAKYIKDNTSFASTVANNSEDVFNFFCENKEITKTDSAGRPVKDQYGNEVKVAVNQGWARKYDTVVTNNSNSGSPIYKKAGTNGSLDKKITSINKQIDTQTQRAEAYLERVWKQFSAMEQRVQNIQAQGSYLAQIGGKAA